MLQEVHDADTLLALLRTHADLGHVRLQSLDLSGAIGQALLDYPGSLADCVVLGGVVPPPVMQALSARGAIVFPAAPHAPVNPYRSHLYTATELYDTLADGYDTTVDARAYAWFKDETLASDSYTSALQALHDDAIRDSLHEVLAERSTIGVMGGHAWARGTDLYRTVAHESKRLADGGHLVLTGGGPGAMEAANLGAATRTNNLDDALDVLARVPSFRPSVSAWALAALEAKDLVVPSDVSEKRLQPSEIRSLGIPTWFYGHEPPNVFGDAIAKYFSNAVREDDLLAGSRRAIITLAGAAGTVQEIFQAVTPLFYAPEDTPLADLILVGETWTQDVPVWPALQALAQGKRFAEHLHLVPTVADAVDLVLTRHSA